MCVLSNFVLIALPREPSAQRPLSRRPGFRGIAFSITFRGLVSRNPEPQRSGALINYFSKLPGHVKGGIRVTLRSLFISQAELAAFPLLTLLSGGLICSGTPIDRVRDLGWHWDGVQPHSREPSETQSHISQGPVTYLLVS